MSIQVSPSDSLRKGSERVAMIRPCRDEDREAAQILL